MAGFWMPPGGPENGLGACWSKGKEQDCPGAALEPRSSARTKVMQGKKCMAGFWMRQVHLNQSSKLFLATLRFRLFWLAWGSLGGSGRDFAQAWVRPGQGLGEACLGEAWVWPWRGLGGVWARPGQGLDEA